MKPAAALLALLCMQRALAAGSPDPWAVRTGPLRVEGPPEMAVVLQHWVRGFSQAHPGIRVQVHLAGTDVGMGALATGRADIAFAGRVAAPQESKAFEWIFRYPPMAVDVMNGGLDRPGHASALVVLTHRDNPLQAVTFGQLKQLLDAHSGVEGPARTWGAAGLGGGWATQEIHFYLPDIETGTGVFWRGRVLEGSRALPWAQVREIGECAGHGRCGNDMGRRIARLVASDRSALAICPLPPNLPPSVKVLAVAAGEDEPPLRPSATNLVAGRYPLARTVRAYVNAAPVNPADPSRAHRLDPGVAVFLKYVLGPEGQGGVDGDSGFLPLDPRKAVAEVQRLDSAQHPRPKLTGRSVRSP